MGLKWGLEMGTRLGNGDWYFGAEKGLEMELGAGMGLKW